MEGCERPQELPARHQLKAVGPAQIGDVLNRSAVLAQRGQPTLDGCRAPEKLEHFAVVVVGTNDKTDGPGLYHMHPHAANMHMTQSAIALHSISIAARSFVSASSKLSSTCPPLA
jgi:hypothetical protein